MLPFELTKDTPYLALSGELWSVFYEYFNRNWSCYKGFLLYLLLAKSPHMYCDNWGTNEMTGWFPVMWACWFRSVNRFSSSCTKPILQKELGYIHFRSRRSLSSEYRWCWLSNPLYKWGNLMLYNGWTKQGPVSIWRTAQNNCSQICFDLIGMF